MNRIKLPLNVHLSYNLPIKQLFLLSPGGKSALLNARINLDYSVMPQTIRYATIYTGDGLSEDP